MNTILLIGPFGTPGHLVHALRAALETLGHEVATLDHRAGSLARAFDMDVDHTLVFRGEGIAPGVVSRLPGTKVLLYAEILHPDPARVLDDEVSRERARVFERSASAYDVVCYHDWTGIETVRALGARRAVWAGIGGVGAHGSLHTRLEVERTVDVGFVGTPSPRRQAALDALRRAGLTVEVRDVRGEAYNAFVNRCKVVLNVHYADLPNTEYRLFEVLGAGACCVSEEVSMPELFADAGCLPTYPLGDHDALAAQVRRLLADDAARARAAEAGYRLAHGALAMEQACASLLWAVEVAMGNDAGEQPRSGLEPYDAAVERWARAAARIGAGGAAGGLDSVGADAPSADAAWAGSRIGQADVWGAEPPRFSVIIPTYNRAPILRRCLDALAQQTFDAARFEVIVCDDGSTDETPGVMSEYEAPYALTYIRQANAGPATARNRAMRLAQGEYVLILNDDAIAHPSLLERHAAAHDAQGDARSAVLGTFGFTPELRRTPFQFALTYWHLLFIATDVLAPERVAASLRGAGVAVPADADATGLAALLNRLVLDPNLRAAWDGGLPPGAPPAEWEEADPESYMLHLNRALVEAWLGEAVRATSEKGWMLFYYHSMRRGERHGPEYFWTCNISLPRAAVEAVGGFDPGFPTAAAEDVDLGLRLARRGYAVVYAPECVTWHDHPQTPGALGRVYRMRGEGETRLWARHPERAQGRHEVVLRRLVQEHGDRAERLEALIERIEATGAEPGTDAFAEAVSLVANVLEPIKVMGWTRGLLDGMERRGAMERADAAAPAGATAGLDRARALLAAGDADGAERVLQAVLAEQPGLAEALAALGDVARSTGRLDRAAVWYERALDAEPSTESAFYSLLEILQEHDRMHEARLVWGRYAEYVPPSEARRAAGQRVVWGSGAGSPADARVAGSWQAQLATAWGCLSSGRTAAGVGVARRLLERCGDDPDVLRGVADLFGQAGLPKEARRCLAAARSLPLLESPLAQ